MVQITRTHSDVFILVEVIIRAATLVEPHAWDRIRLEIVVHAGEAAVA